MKKTFLTRLASVLLCALLLAPAAQSESLAAENGVQLLLSQALSLCAMMDACADEPAYVQLYEGDGAAKTQIARIGAQDWTALEEARLYIIKEKLFSVYLSASSVDYGALSGPVRDKLRDGIPPSVLSMGTSGKLEGFSAAASALRCGKVFYTYGARVPRWCLMHLTFRGEYDALCSFVSTEDGVVSAYLMPAEKDSLSRTIRMLTYTGVPQSELFESLPVDIDP